MGAKEEFCRCRGETYGDGLHVSSSCREGQTKRYKDARVCSRGHACCCVALGVSCQQSMCHVFDSDCLETPKTRWQAVATQRFVGETAGRPALCQVRGGLVRPDAGLVQRKGAKWSHMQASHVGAGEHAVQGRAARGRAGAA